MNYIISILMMLTLLPTQVLGMYSTFYKPTFWLEKPRIDRKNMTSYELTYLYARASQSFNKNGQRVPLLAFSGPESLLPCFVEPLDDCSSNTSICKDNKPIAHAMLGGNFAETTVMNEFIQNIHKHFFIRLNLPITNATLKNISITPTDACGDPIIPNKEINSYIDKLSLKIFGVNSSNKQDASIIGPSFLLFGFMNTFDNFNHLDMLDLDFTTGLVMPIIGVDCKDDLRLFPHRELTNFGIPFQLKCMIGVYNWLNVGFAATIIAHFSKDVVFELNENPYPNHIIIPTRKMAKMFHYPFIALTSYIEGEYFLPHWTWYVGFNFTKQYKTVWNICGATREENEIANRFPSVVPWQSGAITLATEIDFFSQEKKMMPRFKLTYVQRLFGKSCFDTAVFAGHFGFEMLYDF
jgi:hypothetical protein